METIKITDDGFVWAFLDKERAFEIWDMGDAEVWAEHKQGAWWEVVGASDFENEDFVQFYAEIGEIEQLRADWQEACARNNEKRSFSAWLEDKAENLIS